MKPVFYPYKMHSSSSKLLAREFGAERVRVDGKFMNNFKRPIINWGNSILPEWMCRWNDQVILNHPKYVAKAANKLSAFILFKAAGVKHPVWTTNKQEMKQWMEEGFNVIARKTLTGKGGEGIEYLYSSGLDKEVNYLIVCPDAPLYTKYFKKKHEFRVHIVNGTVIDFVQKKVRQGVKPNYHVRSYGNGWVFAREGVILPDCVKEESIKAVAALGLTFGAVDVGYNELLNEACVFEVNTAPGIEGTTVQKYKEAFEEMLK